MPKKPAVDPRERDPRYAGLRGAPTAALWRVPYSAPGTRGGALTIFATSAVDALERARAWHATTPVRPTFDARPRPRSASVVEYGEPVQVGGELG